VGRDASAAECRRTREAGHLVVTDVVLPADGGVVAEHTAVGIGGSWGKLSPLDVVDSLDEPLLAVCERRGHVLTPVERHPAPGFPESDIRSLVEPPAGTVTPLELLLCAPAIYR